MLQPAFQFRVKFYVTDPSRLQEEYTRYQFYLQIRRDIIQGKLACPLNTSCLLASYTVQGKPILHPTSVQPRFQYSLHTAELGDYNPIEHVNGYLGALQLLNEQTDETERRISELHKLHRGQLPADAEYNYLEHAKKLYMYGVDLHRAIDSTGKEIQLGVTSVGLVVFQNNVRINVFSWSKMVKISFKRKDFFIQLRREPVSTLLLSVISLTYFIVFCRAKAMIPCSVSAWAHTRMLRLYGNRASNITRSFVWNVLIVYQDFFHCHSVQSSTIPDAPSYRLSRRVNNEAESRKCSSGRQANG